MHLKYEGQTRDRDVSDYNNFISRYQTTIEANMLQKLLPEKVSSVIKAGCSTDRFIEPLIPRNSSKQKNVLKK